MTIIFKKAKIIYNNTLIIKGETTQKTEYYQVQDTESQKWHSINIKTDLYGTTFGCECMSKTFHIDKAILCSHIIAVIYRKYFETKLK